MDTLPLWFWLPAVLILWSLVLAPTVTAIIHAPADPNPEYSTLDALDGLTSRQESEHR